MMVSCFCRSHSDGRIPDLVYFKVSNAIFGQNNNGLLRSVVFLDLVIGLILKLLKKEPEQLQQESVNRETSWLCKGFVSGLILAPLVVAALTFHDQGRLVMIAWIPFALLPSLLAHSRFERDLPLRFLKSSAEGSDIKKGKGESKPWIMPLECLNE